MVNRYIQIVFIYLLWILSYFIYNQYFYIDYNIEVSNVENNIYSWKEILSNEKLIIDCYKSIMSLEKENIKNNIINDKIIDIYDLEKFKNSIIIWDISYKNIYLSNTLWLNKYSYIEIEDFSKKINYKEIPNFPEYWIINKEEDKLIREKLKNNFSYDILSKDWYLPITYSSYNNYINLWDLWWIIDDINRYINYEYIIKQ